MFTGIVETMAKVLEKTDTGLTVERPENFSDLSLGGSIAINGVCLSIVELDDASMRFTIVPETWERTNLSDLTKNSSVNIERAMSANGRLDGHIVQGHVEGTATVTACTRDGEKGGWLTVELPQDVLPFVLHKGSIALNGVSLTVAKLDGSLCSIALIPHTLAITTLGLLHVGDRVNVETDILAKYARASLSHA